jgi:monoterpene epsilon-lactone hydrolase
MPATFDDRHLAQQSATVFHPINETDKIAMASLRAIVEPHKGQLRGTAARAPFDAIMEHVAVPEGVTFEAGTVGGIPGWWSKPEGAQTDAVILHVHGGGSTGARRKHFAI